MGSGSSHAVNSKHCSSQQPTGELVTLVYVSRMVGQHFADPRSVSALVRFSAANNRDVGITGYLLVAVPFFMQRLEGPPAILNKLLDGIRGDHRHDRLIVVESHPICQRSYGDWAMRSFDIISSAGDRFDAVAFMLQALSVAIQVAWRTLHPALFARLLSNTEGELEDYTHSAFVVTVALGTAILNVDANQQIVASIEVLYNVAQHLRKRLCILNPEGRSPITLFAGSFLQVVVSIPEVSYNFANKVLRSCAELVGGYAGVQCPDIKVSVENGDVHVVHLARFDDLRKGRYVYGAPMTRGLAVAKRLLQSDVQANLVVSPAVAVSLQDEFRMQSIIVAGYPLRSIKVYDAPAKKVIQELNMGDTIALSSEAAIATLLRMADCPEAAEVKGVTSETEEVPHTPPPHRPENLVSDLEWIYGLETAADGRSTPTGQKKLRGIHGRAFRRKVSRVDAAARLRSAPTPPAASLLNIVYISMMAEHQPMSAAQLHGLGEQSNHDNSTRGVTGFLLCTRPFFLQCLEGPPMEVKEVFLKIYRDSRHRNVTVLAFRHISARSFATWPMRTMDLDAGTTQDTAPLREVLLLLTRRFTSLQAWLTRLHHDLLLSWVQLRPKAHAQCTIVAFAAIRHNGPEGNTLVTTMLHALSPFLALGGEILGFLGDHLVGYTFVASQAMLMDEVVDLCAFCETHVGVAAGQMLLLNTEAVDCDVAFYGPVFDKARALADRAASLNVPIMAEANCQVQVTSLTWECLGSVAVGRLDFEPGNATIPVE